MHTKENATLHDETNEPGIFCCIIGSSIFVALFYFLYSKRHEFYKYKETDPIRAISAHRQAVWVYGIWITLKGLIVICLLIDCFASKDSNKKEDPSTVSKLPLQNKSGEEPILNLEQQSTKDGELKKI